MDNLNSLVGFFYNIIPGFIFLIINDYYFHFFSLNNPRNSIIFDNPFRILILLVISLSVGFLFQSLTKICRNYLGLNKCIFVDIKCNDEKIYNSALSKLGDIDRKDKTNIVNIFYLMHNYLSSCKTDRLPEYFSARFAFWSNTFFGSLFTFIIFFVISKQKSLFGLDESVSSLLIIGAVLYSAFISRMYLHDMYASILKSFVVMTTKIKGIA